METLNLSEGTGCISSGDTENDDTLSNRSHMQSRLLYVTVGQHDDTYSFPPSRVSPMDPNLNSVQYLSTHQIPNVPHQNASDIIGQYTQDQHFPPNSQFSPQDESLNKTANMINSNLVLEGIDSTLLGQDSGLVQSHFNGYVSQIPVLNDLEGNLSNNTPNFHNISNPNSPMDGIQQISLRNDSIDYINIDTNGDPNFITQLNNGSILLKHNVNGRYFQQVLNSNIVINNGLTENNDLHEDITSNGLLTRIPENLLSELQDNDDLQNITLNRNVDLNRFLNNQDQLDDSKILPKTQNTFKKYVLPQNVNINKRSTMKSNLYQEKKILNKKTRDVFASSPVDSQLLPHSSGMNSSDQNSDSLAVSPIDLYENSSSYEFGSQPNEDGCVVEDNGQNSVIEDNEAREDYLVVDGGLYSLNGFKTQGFLIEQTSGDLMVCQQLDGQLAIDQSMLDIKLNQMLNMNQDLNLSLNYDDQIILDQNGRILLKTEMANDLEKEAMLTNDVVFNNLTQNIEQDLIMENEMNDIDMKINIMNEIGGEDVDSKFDGGKNNEKCADSDNVRRSKRSVKSVNGTQKQDVFTITDKTVLSRAWASLPAMYLNIFKINAVDNDTVYGVFARRPIPARTQFGPLEGVKVFTKIANESSNVVQYRLKVDNGYVTMDVSDENTSNWMRFVRSADSHSVQNLVMSEDSGKLYFTSIRHIDPKTELRVWYGEEYASAHGFKLLEMTSEEKIELNESKYSWPCYECSKKFLTSEELHRHLNEHDDPKKSSKLSTESSMKSPVSKVKRVRTNILNRRLTKAKQTNKTIVEKKSLNIYVCDVCSRPFPRRYSLKRHMLTHKLKNIPNTPNSENKTVVDNSHVKVNAPEKENQEPEKNNGGQKNVLLIKQEILDTPENSLDKESAKDNIDEKVEPKIDDEKKSLKCSLCPKVFSLFKDRLEHQLSIHQNEEHKTYVCSQCPKKFYNLVGLTCHLKNHPWLKCPMCEKNFTVVGALREHVKVHCVNGVFTCNHCKKKFTQYRLIRKHIRAFHSDRKIPCPQCNKMFPAQDKLRMHLLRHSDHREFLCAHCGKQFKRKDKLSEHMKCVHEQQQNTQNQTPNEKPVERNYEMNNASVNSLNNSRNKPKKFMPRVSPNDYHRFIYKCHSCLLGFKRRGMLVNHLAKRHPDIKPESVPELNLPILRTTRNYYCQYCCKVYKSSSKRKAHILKIHPGLSLPLSNRHRGGLPEIPGMPNPTYSQTVGSVTSHPHPCNWCHKQYASKAKLLQHQRKKHNDLLAQMNDSANNQNTNTLNPVNNETIHQNPNGQNHQFFKIISQQQHHQITENGHQNSDEIPIEFDTIDPDDPGCYNHDDMKLVQNGGDYNNYEIQTEVQNIQNSVVIPSISMKLEKTPIVIDVTQLDQYRKTQMTKQDAAKSKIGVKNSVNENLNRTPKKWGNNFSFVSYPAR